MSKVAMVTRSDLLEKERTLGPTRDMKKRLQENSLFLITTNSPEYSGINDLVRENWDILKRSSTTKILAETRIIFGYRRPKNLKDLLIQAKLPALNQPKRRVPHCEFANKCKNRKCVFCPLLNKSGKIKSTYTGREYKCKCNVTCKSNNLIYCITCSVCQKQYIGQTGDTLHKRFGAHAGSINRKNLKDDIGRHFNLPDHHGLEDMTLHILDFIFAPPKSPHGLTLRLQIEFNWIQRMRTMLPFGLNTKDRTPLESNCRSWRNYRQN